MHAPRGGYALFFLPLRVTLLDFEQLLNVSPRPRARATEAFPPQLLPHLLPVEALSIWMKRHLS